jgi:O-antigen/teichoic acid export membrane protein
MGRFLHPVAALQPGQENPMKATAGLGRNTLWLVFSRFGTQALAVLFTIVVARRLGSAGFGEYAFIAAVIFLGNALTTFGTDMLLIREIAARADLSRLPAALVIQLGLSAIFIIAVLLVAPVLPNQSPAVMTGLEIYSFALLPLAFFSVFTTALRGKQCMDAYTLLTLAVNLLPAAAAWLFLHTASSVVTLALILLLVQVAGAVIAGWICTVQIPGFWQSWRFSLPESVALLKMAAPIALIALIGILYQKISIAMLSTLDGPAVTGWFSAALRVLEASKTVHLAAFTALYPAMAQSAGAGGVSLNGGVPWRGSFRLSWKFLVLGAGLISTALFFLAAPLTALLYGNDFAPAVAALRLLAWVLIPFTINTFYSLFNLANHKEKLVMRVQLAGLVALVVLNAWWIPRWGLNGACLAAILAESAQAALYLTSAVDLPQQARRLISAVMRP